MSFLRYLMRFLNKPREIFGILSQVYMRFASMLELASLNIAILTDSMTSTKKKGSISF